MKISADDRQLQRLLLGQERFLEAVHGILEEEQQHDDLLRAVVRTSQGTRSNPVPAPDAERIFDLATIQRMCVKYRLRFLHAKWYRGTLPVQAIHAVRRAEEAAGTPLQGFKILAPARAFRLCDSEADPLLFVPLANDRFYLIHKWGRDLSWYRSVLCWPLRSVRQLAATVFMFALCAASAVPTSLLAGPGAEWWGAHRLFFLFWAVMVTTAFTVFSWFAFHGRFSADAWKSRHFD